ncbi:MAG: hypothetical protein AAF957_09580 [Planctomycetota bacterium]
MNRPRSLAALPFALSISFLAPTLLTTSLAQSSLVGVELFTNDVYRLDVGTGVTTRIGTVTGVNADVGSIGRAPDGNYYGLTTGSSSTLYRIDPVTWSATLLAPLGMFSFEGGIAISPSGDAWVVNGGSAGSPFLYEADLATGTTTLVGPLSGGSHDINGMAYRSDGMLIGLDRVTNAIVEIDPGTAALTVLSPVSDIVGAAGGVTIEAGVGHFATAGTTTTLPGTNSLFRFDPITGVSTLVAPFTGDMTANGFSGLTGEGSGTIGTNYCMANPNSTGSIAEMSAFGSILASSNDLELRATSLPANSFGYFLTSRTEGFVPNPGGSAGVLCLSGMIGRYVGPGQIQNSGASGEITLQIDLTQTPTPMGFVSVMAGEDWNFQAWYRDAVAGTPTSNFTDGLEIVFL